MATPSERLAALEQRLTDHEARCEERLAEIRATATTTLKAVEGLKSRSWGLAAAFLAWALERLEAHAPASAAAERASPASG